MREKSTRLLTSFMLIIKIMALSLQWMCAESCYAKTKSATSGSACGLERERICANIDRFKTRPFIASNNCHKGKADKVSTPRTKIKIDCLEAKKTCPQRLEAGITDT